MKPFGCYTQHRHKLRLFTHPLPLPGGELVAFGDTGYEKPILISPSQEGNSPPGRGRGGFFRKFKLYQRQVYRVLGSVFVLAFILFSCQQDKTSSARGDELLTAAWNGDATAVETFLKKGVDVNVQDPYQATPLMYAAHRGHLEVAEVLLAHEADVHITDQAQVTALMEASRNGHLPVVALLLEHGADVNARDKNLNTPLIFAANGRSVQVIQVLLEYGADVNAANHVGITPLISAAWNDKPDNVRTLLLNGADIHAATPEGKTALMLAKERGHASTVEVLEAFGASELQIMLPAIGEWGKALGLEPSPTE